MPSLSTAILTSSDLLRSSSDGISFAIQAFLFILLGSLADYGTFRPWILIVFTALSIGISFAWLGATSPSSWDPTGTALYILGLVAYQISLTFWTAAFPALARCSPEVRQAEVQLREKEIKPEEFEMTERLTRNRISNVSFAVCSVSCASGNHIASVTMIDFNFDFAAGRARHSCHHPRDARWHPRR